MMAFGFGYFAPAPSLADTLESMLSSVTRPIMHMASHPQETAKAALTFAQEHPHIMVATTVTCFGLYQLHKKGYFEVGTLGSSIKLNATISTPVISAKANFEIATGRLN